MADDVRLFTTGTGSVTVPAGIVLAKIEVWGAGGGGSVATGQEGGGAAGRYVAIDNVTVSGGQIFYYTIGVGGIAGGAGASTSFSNASTYGTSTTGIQVDGGASTGGTGNAGSKGAWATLTANNIGGSSTAAQGGGGSRGGSGGGGSGGPLGIGAVGAPGASSAGGLGGAGNNNTAAGGAQAVAGTSHVDGGGGGGGGYSGASGGVGGAPGGGGGGGGSSGGNAGIGGRGQVRITFYTPSIADAWNANDISANITLSNSDKKAVVSAAVNSGVRSTTTNLNGSTGKYYAEFLLDATSVPGYIGITPTTNSLTSGSSNFHVLPAGSVVVNAGVVGLIGTALTVGEVICVAWDTLLERVWFRKGAGNWNNSGTADPATNTGGFNVSFAASTAHALWICGDTSGMGATIRTELAEYTQTIPAGFKSWMGETPSVANAWNVNDKSDNIILSNADKTATHINLDIIYAVRSTKHYLNGAAGKYYAEFIFDTITNPIGLYVGIIDTTFGLTASSRSFGINGDGIYWAHGGTPGNIDLGTPVNGDVISIAWNSGTETFWVRINSGNWNNDPTANPATGVNGFSVTTAAANNHALWFNSSYVGNVGTVRTEAAEFTQLPPSGFLSWMGESLSTSVTVTPTGVSASTAVGSVTVVIPVSDAWNVGDKTSDMTLSNGDKTAINTSIGTSQTVRSTKRHTAGSAGKLYAEFVVHKVDGSKPVYLGIASISHAITSGNMFNLANTACVWNDGKILVNQSMSSKNVGIPNDGDVLSFAWDDTAHLLWFRRNNGDWNEPGGNPATGVGGLTTTGGAGFSGLMALGVCSTTTGTIGSTIRTEASEFTQTAPSGFLSWMGESLAPSPNVTVSATGVAGTGSVGSVTVSTVASTTFSVTGVEGTGAVGTATAKVNTTSAVTGNAATGAVGDVAVTAKWNVSTTVTGTAGTGAVGTATVTATRNINTTVTGVAATGSVGTATVRNNVTVGVTGVNAVGNAGTATVRNNVTAVTTGVAATGGVGTVVVTAKQNINTTVTGVNAAGNVGTATVIAKQNILAIVTGVSAAGEAGTASATGKQNIIILPTGVESTGDIGSVSISVGGSVSFGVSGVEAFGDVGTVNVLAAAAAATVGVWSGTAWVQKPAKVWTGAVWATKPVKVWNGSAWV